MCVQAYAHSDAHAEAIAYGILYIQDQTSSLILMNLSYSKIFINLLISQRSLIICVRSARKV